MFDDKAYRIAECKYRYSSGEAALREFVEAYEAAKAYKQPEERGAEKGTVVQEIGHPVSGDYKAGYADGVENTLQNIDSAKGIDLPPLASDYEQTIAALDERVSHLKNTIRVLANGQLVDCAAVVIDILSDFYDVCKFNSETNEYGASEAWRKKAQCIQSVIASISEWEIDHPVGYTDFDEWMRREGYGDIEKTSALYHNRKTGWDAAMLSKGEK